MSALERVGAAAVAFRAAERAYAQAERDGADMVTLARRVEALVAARVEFRRLADQHESETVGAR